MNDIPQHGTDDGQQDDLLEQIFTDGLNRLAQPTEQASPEEAASQPAEKTKTAEPEVRKNKRSSVYIYLLILFGAAFFMLLLAYFIQQRNSETTISDLRNSMNLSREDMLEQIETLKKESDSWQALLHDAERQKAETEEQLKLRNQTLDEISDTYLQYYYSAHLSSTLGWLERFCAEGEWFVAAAIVTQTDCYFNEHNISYSTGRPRGMEASPVQVQRYLELREQVFDNAGCMVMETYSEDQEHENYTERPYMLMQENITNTAIELWCLFSTYSDPHENRTRTAADYAKQIHDNRFLQKSLEDGGFLESTVELYQQIFDEFLERGLLEMDEDGKVTVHYTEMVPLTGDGEKTDSSEDDPQSSQRAAT